MRPRRPTSVIIRAVCRPRPRCVLVRDVLPFPPPVARFPEGSDFWSWEVSSSPCFSGRRPPVQRPVICTPPRTDGTGLLSAALPLSTSTVADRCRCLLSRQSTLGSSRPGAGKSPSFRCRQWCYGTRRECIISVTPVFLMVTPFRIDP